MQAELNSMERKLQLTESKLRQREQLDRDENMITSVVSPAKFREIRSECENMRSHLKDTEAMLEVYRHINKHFNQSFCYMESHIYNKTINSLMYLS